MATDAHMLTIGDDGHLLVTTLWKLNKIKYFDINHWCVQKNLYTEKNHILRKLKSIAITTELAISVNEIPLSTCERILANIGENGDMVAKRFIGANHERAKTAELTRNKNGIMEIKPIKNNGNVAIGTSCGEVILIPLGNTV